MNTFYLLTYHGTVVCRDDKNRWLVHKPPAECFSKKDIAKWRFENGARLLLLKPDDSVSDQSHFPTSSYTITYASRPGLIHLQRAGRYVRAASKGEVDELAQQAKGWEEFLLISEREFDVLIRILGKNWILKSSRSIVAASEIRMLSDFRLQLGPHALSLAPYMPIIPENENGNETCSFLLFYDGWKVEQLVLFRPLLYFAVFGHERYAKMAALCLRSFMMHHGFGLEALILTNLDQLRLKSVMPGEIFKNIRVWPVQASSFFDFCIQRYRIAEWKESSIFQPVLYLDTDMLFDRDISSLLVDLALSPSLMVAGESWSYLRRHPSVGSSLLLEDKFEPSFENGFNSGAIGIPNVTTHALQLKAVAEMMNRYATLHGQTSLHWFDQASANYVWAKIGSIDTTKLAGIMTHVTRNDEVIGERKGLVHFWGAKNKLAAMEAYFSSLRAGNSSDPSPRLKPVEVP